MQFLSPCLPAHRYAQARHIFRQGGSPARSMVMGAGNRGVATGTSDGSRMYPAPLLSVYYFDIGELPKYMFVTLHDFP